MRAALKRTLLALAAAAVASAAIATLASAPAGRSAPTRGALAPPRGAAGAELLGAGPGGRTTLARWTLARDPSDRGLARGWQRGGFAGRAVSVPNVVDASDIK